MLLNCSDSIKTSVLSLDLFEESEDVFEQLIEALQFGYISSKSENISKLDDFFHRKSLLMPVHRSNEYTPKN